MVEIRLDLVLVRENGDEKMGTVKKNFLNYTVTSFTVTGQI